MTDIVERLRREYSLIGCSLHSDAAYEIERLRDYIAKHNELVQKLTIELAEYQVKEHKVGIKRAAIAKLGADNGEWKIVPVEPTLEMKMAASDYLIEHQNDEFYAEDIYKVMVAKVGADKGE